MGEGSTTDATRARGQIYRFLASLFLDSPPVESVRELLKGDTLDELSHTYGEGSVGGLRSLDPASVDAGAEFDRLFRIPTEGFVPACESVYRDTTGEGRRKEGRLYGPSCRAAAELMREAGAEIPEGVGQPPDHLGVEFLFLSYLCEREAEARDAEDADRLERWLGREFRFLREHPATWVEDFVRRVEESVPGGFYAGVGNLVRGVIETDLRYLSDA